MTNTFDYLGMNTQKPPFNDVRVRRAIAYAIPYEPHLRDRALRPWHAGCGAVPRTC